MKDPFLDQSCVGDSFQFLVDRFRALLPSTIPPDTLEQSLLHLAGDKLTHELLDVTCWRLAGNLQRLKRRKPVVPWHRQTHKEWVPVQITSARRRRNHKGDPGWNYTFTVMAGTPCAIKIQKLWTDKFIRYMIGHLGFNTRRQSMQNPNPATHVFQHALELVGLRLDVLIDPKLCSKEPSFDETDVPPSSLEYNRIVMTRRDRLEVGYGCPFKFPETSPCFRCPKGIVSCKAAVHQQDYIIDFCPECSNEHAAFDPDVSNDMCVSCVDREAMKRK